MMTAQSLAIGAHPKTAGSSACLPLIWAALSKNSAKPRRRRFIWLRSRVRTLGVLSSDSGTTTGVRMNSESERPRNQLAAVGLHRFGANPGQQEAWQAAEGELVIAYSGHNERVGAVDALVLFPVAGGWCGEGCTAPSIAP